jgi:hypothetical protein
LAPFQLGLLTPVSLSVFLSLSHSSLDPNLPPSNSRLIPPNSPLLLRHSFQGCSNHGRHDHSLLRRSIWVRGKIPLPCLRWSVGGQRHCPACIAAPKKERGTSWEGKGNDANHQKIPKNTGQRGRNGRKAPKLITPPHSFCNVSSHDSKNLCQADHALEVQDDLEILIRPSPASATPHPYPSDRGSRKPRKLRGQRKRLTKKHSQPTVE